jgi:2-keto-4-pentenoate hydratase/2-oxohepta-3-ene-1,7-dioic acid hydratase in catechol pathway
MRIFGIARNYKKHNQEMAQDDLVKPAIFQKPDSALLKYNQPFYYPKFSDNIHFETELVVRIDKEGKHIDEKFANRYYREISLGIDFTARDIQTEAKKERLPWTFAKGFDQSAVLGRLIELSPNVDIQNIDLELIVNGKVAQKGNTSDMLFQVDFIISYISKYITLKKGDLIYTGTPEGVGPVHVGDNLVGKLAGEELFNFEVK